MGLLFLAPSTWAHDEDSTEASVPVAQICDLLSLNRAELKEQLYRTLVRDIPGGDSSPLLFTAAEETQEAFAQVLAQDKRAQKALQEGKAFRDQLQNSADLIFLLGHEDIVRTLTPVQQLLKRVERRVRILERTSKPRSLERAQAIAAERVQKIMGIDPSRPFESLSETLGPRTRRRWSQYQRARQYYQIELNAALRESEIQAHTRNSNTLTHAILLEELTHSIEALKGTLLRTTEQALQIIQSLDGRLIFPRVRAQSQEREEGTEVHAIKWHSLSDIRNLRLTKSEDQPPLLNRSTFVPIPPKAQRSWQDRLQILFEPVRNVFSNRFWFGTNYDRRLPLETSQILGGKRFVANHFLSAHTITETETTPFKKHFISLQFELEDSTYETDIFSLHALIASVFKSYNPSRHFHLRAQVRALYAVENWLQQQIYKLATLSNLRQLIELSSPSESLPLVHTFASKEKTPALANPEIQIGLRYLLEENSLISRPLQNLEWFGYFQSDNHWSRRDQYFNASMKHHQYVQENVFTSIRRQNVTRSRRENHFVRFIKTTALSVGIISAAIGAGYPKIHTATNNPESLHPMNDSYDAEQSEDEESVPVFSVRSTGDRGIPTYFYDPSIQELEDQEQWIPYRPQRILTNTTRLEINSLRSISPTHSGDLFLFYPPNYRLIRVEVIRTHDSVSLTQGLDFTIFQNPRTRNLKAHIRSGRFSPEEGFQIRAFYQHDPESALPHSPTIVQLWNTPFSNAKIAQIEREYREQGLTHIYESMQSLDRNTPIRLRDLLTVHQTSTRYSHHHRLRFSLTPWISDTPFARITRFLRDSEGTLYMECDGSGEFFQETLNRLDPPFQYEPAHAYVFSHHQDDPSIGTLGSIAHTQTRIWFPENPEEFVLADPTSLIEGDDTPPPARPITLKEALPRWIDRNRSFTLPEVQPLENFSGNTDPPFPIPPVFQSRPFLHQEVFLLLSKTRETLLETPEFRQLIKQQDFRNAPGRLLAVSGLLQSLQQEHLSPLQFWIALAEIYPDLYAENEFDENTPPDLSMVGRKILEHERSAIDRLTPHSVRRRDFDVARLKNVSEALLLAIVRGFQ